MMISLRAFAKDFGLFVADQQRPLLFRRDPLPELVALPFKWEFLGESSEEKVGIAILYETLTKLGPRPNPTKRSTNRGEG